MKRTVTVTVILCFLIASTGCATMPEKKYMVRLNEEERDSLQKDIEFNRGMWQLASFGLGVWAGCGDSSPRDTKSIITTSVLGSLSFLGIASLCNLHTYRENDPEKTGLIAGLLIGAGAGGAYSVYLSADSMAHPNEFMFLPVFFAPIIIIVSGLTGAGLGAAIGKMIPSSN